MASQTPRVDAYMPVRISAATFPIVCVDSVLPVPGRAGKLRSLTDDADAGERARLSENEDPGDVRQVQGEGLTRMARRQEAAGRSDNSWRWRWRSGLRRGPGSSSRSRVFELQRRHSGPDARSRWRGGEDLMVRCRGRDRAWISRGPAIRLPRRELQMGNFFKDRWANSPIIAPASNDEPPLRGPRFC